MSAGPTDRGRWRRKLYSAQEGVCPYCPEPLPPPSEWRGFLAVSLDHVFPRSRQPERGHRGNMLLAHSECNLAKANRLPTPEEVAFLDRVNKVLEIRARGAAPTPEERAAQSARDKAAHAAKLAAERRPAALGLLDDCAAAIFESRQPLKFGETECSSN
jgi:hypothetical protein